MANGYEIWEDTLWLYLRNNFPRVKTVRWNGMLRKHCFPQRQGYLPTAS